MAHSRSRRSRMNAQSAQSAQVRRVRHGTESVREEAARLEAAQQLPPAQLRLPEELREAMREVLTAAEQAKLEALYAGGTEADADLSRVKDLLSRNRRLTRWLTQAETLATERERAIQAGLAGQPYYGEAGGIGSFLGMRPQTDDRFGAAGSRTIDDRSAEVQTWASPTGRVTGTGSRYDNRLAPNDWRNNADAVNGAGLLRDFSMTDEWVRAAINRRRSQVGHSKLAVIPANPLKPYNKGLARAIQLLLDMPNEGRQNRRELLEAVTEDILVLDRGVISKDMDLARRPHALYAEDGATIRIYSGWTGDPNEPRYLYVDPGSARRIPLRNDQVICIMENPASYRNGLSPVMVLKQTIENDLAAMRSAKHMVDMKPPPAIIQFPGAQQNQITAIRDYYDMEVAGRKEAFFVGGESDINVEKLVFSARDNQWLEWQEYLCRKIAIIFKMPPSLFGANFHASMGDPINNINWEMFADEGFVELLTLIEEYLNRELLADFAPKLSLNREDIESLNLKIVFPQVGEINRQMHAERAAAIAADGLVQLPSFTLNQILSMRGEELVAGGNTFYVNTSLGPVPWLSYDGNIANYNPLQLMAGLDDDGSESGTNHSTKPVKPKLPQPGSPQGQAGDPQQPPKKPSTAPTPRDAASRNSGNSGRPRNRQPVGGNNRRARQPSGRASQGRTRRHLDPALLGMTARQLRAVGQLSAAEELETLTRAYQHRALFDGREPGTYWTPGAATWQQALDDLYTEEMQIDDADDADDQEEEEGAEEGAPGAGEPADAGEEVTTEAEGIAS